MDAGAAADYADAALELGDARVRVAVATARGRWLLRIEGHGDWSYDPARRRIALGAVGAPDDPATALAALRGPVLLHALAHEGVHVLHAAGIRTATGVIALTAPSGVGKSSFAARAAARGVERVADDLLPIGRAAPDGFVARPHLHQPRLAAAEQYPARAPVALPLRAIVALTRGAAATCDALDPRACFDLLVRATVGTRVYPPALLAAHFAFCAALADAAERGGPPVVRLVVPHRPGAVASALDEAWAVLRQWLAAAPAALR